MATAMGGYSLVKIIQFPRLYLDRNYRKSFGGQDLGGKDAGFVAMVYGFGVFFLCIALAPSTCFGVWVALPVWCGTLPLDQAADLVVMCALRSCRLI